MFDRIKAKEEAKQKLKDKAPVVFLPILIELALIGMLTGIATKAYITDAFSGIVYFMTASWMLNYVRTGETSLDHYFDCLKSFNRDVEVVLTWLLSIVFIALWTCLLIIPGVIKALAYSMVAKIMVDKKDCSYMNCLRLSEDMMKGHKMELFKLYLSFLGWIILCILTCGILYIWKAPYMYVTETLFYEYVRKEYEMDHPGTFPDLADVPNNYDESGDIIDGEIFS